MAPALPPLVPSSLWFCLLMLSPFGDKMNIVKILAGAALAAAPLSALSAQAVPQPDSGSSGSRGEWIAGTGALAGAGLFLAFTHSSHDGSATGGYGPAFNGPGTTPATTPTATPTPSPNGNSTPTNRAVRHWHRPAAFGYGHGDAARHWDRHSAAESRAKWSRICWSSNSPLQTTAPRPRRPPALCRNRDLSLCWRRVSLDSRRSSGGAESSSSLATEKAGEA